MINTQNQLDIILDETEQATTIEQIEQIITEHFNYLTDINEVDNRFWWGEISQIKFLTIKFAKKYKQYLTFRKISIRSAKKESNIQIHELIQHFPNKGIWGPIIHEKQLKRQYILKYIKYFNILNLDDILQNIKITPKQQRIIIRAIKKIRNGGINYLTKEELNDLANKSKLHKREKFKLLNVKFKNKPKHYSRKIYINLLAEEMKNK